MKKCFAWAALLPAVMLMNFTACQKEPKQVETPASVSIKADASFSDAGEATVTVSLSAATVKNVMVTLAASTEAQSGYTAVSAADLSFNSTVTLPVGSTSASVKVSTDISKLDKDNQAVITIASADGAPIDKNAATVYIAVPANIAKEMSGADTWKLFGDFEAIELTKTADNPETWTVEYAEITGAFTFAGTKGNATLSLGTSAEVTLGADIALTKDGAALHPGEGAYNITLYPAELKAVITEGKHTKPFELKWTVEYHGHQWVEGYETAGQVDVFEVSNTDTDKYYLAMYGDLGTYGADFEEDPIAFIKGMQATIDEKLQDYDSKEDFLYYNCYNELVDGTTLLMYGQPVGEYEFLVLSLDPETCQLDLGYKYITFTIDTDPDSQYDWGITAHLKNDWTAEFDSWVPGYTGTYANVNASVPGAAYVYMEIWTDEEIEKDLKGDVGNMIGNMSANLAEYIEIFHEYGVTDEEMPEYLEFFLGVCPVDADGKVSTYIPTYGLEEGDIYILGFDADFNYLAGYPYGKSHVVFPEPEPIETSLQEGWSVTLDGEPQINNKGKYYQDVIVTAPDIQYFLLEEDTDDDLDYFYDGSVAVLITDFNDTVAQYMSNGQEVSDICFSLESEEIYFWVYNTGVETTIYLMEFDEEGQATGRYGATTLVIPELTEAASPVPDTYRVKVTRNKEKAQAKQLAKAQIEKNARISFKAQPSCSGSVKKQKENQKLQLKLK